MKSTSILTLTLALGLFIGCSQKETAPDAAMKSDAAATAKPLDGEAFLAANAKKDGVITTASGLQYGVIKSGTGASPKATDQVKVHYTGTTIDGNVFDSSVQRGQPAVFPVNAVIPGWTEALQFDEGRRQMAVIYSGQAGLRPAKPQPGDSAQQRFDL